MNRVERTWLILNPAAGKGRAERAWPTVAAQLGARGIRFTQAVTCGPGDATLLTQQALIAGATQLIVAGGDGTLNEVVNGLAAAQIAKTNLPKLALLPLGTGTDFARGHGIRSLDDALTTLQYGQLRALDLGVARFHDPRGAEEERAFVNVADFGLGPRASQQIARVDRRLGSGAYLYGALRAIAAYAPVSTRVTVDDHLVYDASCGLLAIGNSRYFGGGMRITPLARTDDGLLDVVILGATDRRTLVSELLPSVYRGSHLRHPAVHFARGTTITVDATPPLPLELDGEIVGTTPARFTLLSAQLSLITPRDEYI